MSKSYYNTVFWLKFPRYQHTNTVICQKDSIRFLLISTLHILLFVFVGSCIQSIASVYILLGLIEIYIRKSNLSKAKIQRYTITLLILLILILISTPIHAMIDYLLGATKNPQA